MFALKTFRETSVLQLQNQGTSAQLGEIQQLQRQISTRLDRYPLRPADSMPEALASTVQVMAEAARRYSINIAEANLKNAAAANETLVTTVSGPVPGLAGLRHTAYLVKGEYLDLPSFNAFLAEIETTPASIDRLRIVGRKFETTISIYGK